MACFEVLLTPSRRASRDQFGEERRDWKGHSSLSAPSSFVLPTAPVTSSWMNRTRRTKFLSQNDILHNISSTTKCMKGIDFPYSTQWNNQSRLFPVKNRNKFCDKLLPRFHCDCVFIVHRWVFKEKLVQMGRQSSTTPCIPTTWTSLSGIWNPYYMTSSLTIFYERKTTVLMFFLMAAVNLFKLEDFGRMFLQNDWWPDF